MDTVKVCENCGKPLPTDAPQGVCPECLMQAGFATGTQPDPEGKGAPKSRSFIPPTVEELAALFPQLEIVELLGRGGMGAVYKARQKELDRFVALKILPPGIGDDPSFAERFAREARALAKLNHPNIVTLYEFGQAGGTATDPSRPSTLNPRRALYYFLMEFVDGVNLRQLLETSRVSSREALAIVPQICDALQFAHDHGIVHRDIKPENILLDRLGRVKVADFGLAKIVGHVAQTSTSAGSGGVPAASSDTERGRSKNSQAGKPAPHDLTDAGKVMGTPQYMAPEQIERPLEVDHRVDIYAIGVVFYQMLTGELPGKKIEPPSSRMRGMQIDVRLDEVVLRALEANPERRYSQASAMKTAVETIVTSQQSRPGGGSAQTMSDRVGQSPHAPPVIVPENKPWIALCTMVAFAGTVGFGVLCELLRGGAPGGWLIAVFLLLCCIGPVLSLVLNRFADAGTIRLAFTVAAWFAFFTSLPVIGFAAFFLFALTQESGGWNPAPAEAVLVPLTWLGAVALPICGLRLWRASRESHARLKESAARPGSGRRWAGVGVLIVLLAGTALFWLQKLQRLDTPIFSESPQAMPTVASHEPFPKAAHIGRNDRSVFLVHDDEALHYALFHAGDFNSSSRSSNNPRTQSWTDDGSLSLGNGRTFGYFRDSSDPDHLRINGREFDLRSGRLLVLRDDGSAEQLREFPSLAQARDVDRLAELSGIMPPPADAMVEAAPAKDGSYFDPVPSEESGLEFRLVADDDETNVPVDLLPFVADSNRPPARVKRPVLLGGDALQSARLQKNPINGTTDVAIELTDEGARRFAGITRTNIGRQLALVYEGRVLSSPVIRSEIPGGSAMISGRLPEGELIDLVWRLNRSARAAPAAPVADRKFSLRWDPNEPIAGQPALFDLDRVRVVNWPEEAGDWNESRLGRWIEESGADLLVAPMPHPRLGLFATKLVSVDHALWVNPPGRMRLLEIVSAGIGDDVEAEHLPELHTELRAVTLGLALPATYGFRTAEGAVGLLHAESFGEYPLKALVHYRLAGWTNQVSLNIVFDQWHSGEPIHADATNDASRHPPRPAPIAAPTPRESRDLIARYEAGQAIRSFSDRDPVMATLAADAARLGDWAIAQKALGQMTMFTAKDGAAAEAARLLARRNLIAEAIQLAGAMTSFTEKDEVMGELAVVAARRGDWAATQKALKSMTAFTARDEAAAKAAGLLAKIGYRAEAMDIAKTITSLSRRDEVLKELAR